MHHACLHCQKPLGHNAEIEALPIGRALAFDAACGRLWVICRACRRWNLTPLDARFEAIEACERLWRETPTRYASGEIGLAVRPSKLRLIRVGRPEREEFAFWRYGAQFVGRRRMANALGAAGLALMAAQLASLGPAVVLGVSTTALVAGFNYWVFVRTLLTRTRIPNPADPADLIRVNMNSASQWLVARDDSGVLKATRPLRAGIEHRPAVHFLAADAEDALARLMPVVNHEGAGRKRVHDATDLIARAGSPERFLEQLIPVGEPGRALARIALAERLALELAFAETREREFLEGSLDRLSREWAEAERIAAIADNLLIPDSVDAAWRRLRAARDRPPTD